jgi:hypothetical protein
LSAFTNVAISLAAGVGYLRALPGDWRNRATITIAQCAEVLDVALNTAYAAARKKQIPIIEVCGRKLVCVPALLRKLDGSK